MTHFKVTLKALHFMKALHQRSRRVRVPKALHFMKALHQRSRRVRVPKASLFKLPVQDSGLETLALHVILVVHKVPV